MQPDSLPMKTNSRLLSCFLLVSTFFLSLAHARLIEVWPYEKLAAASDCVAILEPLENKAAKDTLPERPQRYIADDFHAINTRFRVHALFKAKESVSNELTVLHFAYSRQATNKTFLNGAWFISFPIEQRTSKAAFGPEQKMPGKMYLAFLKWRADGRFEPVRGQYDSRLSFRELHECYQ
jgi:hypothetical protein